MAAVPVEGIAVLADRDERTPIGDPFFQFSLEIEPREVAAIALLDALEQLRRRREDPLRLLLAFRSSQLALQAALIAALAGPEGWGVYSESRRREHIEFDRLRDSPSPPRLPGDGVPRLRDLCAMAFGPPLPWTGKRIAVSEVEERLLDWLTLRRNHIEHLKPAKHLLPRSTTLEAMSLAARLTVELLEEISHQFEEPVLRQARNDGRELIRLCAEMTAEPAAEHGG